MAWTYLASWTKALALLPANLTTYLVDNVNYLKGLAGVVEIDNDLRIRDSITGKGMRFRRSGSALDIDFIGDEGEAFDVNFNWGVQQGLLPTRFKLTKDGQVHGAATDKCSEGLGLTYTPVYTAHVHPTNTAGWQVLALSSLPAGVVAVEMMMTNNSGSVEHNMGVRPHGSTLSPIIRMNYKSTTMKVTAVDASKQIDIYSYGSGAATYAEYSLFGYFL